MMMICPKIAIQSFLYIDRVVPPPPPQQSTTITTNTTKCCKSRRSLDLVNMSSHSLYTHVQYNTTVHCTIVGR